MRLSSCLSPRLLRNRYTGERVSCRCGKCAACLNARAKDWLNRLQLESQAHKYCYMVNLTYDNDHVPRLGFSDDMESVIFMNRHLDWRIPLHELISLCTDQADLVLLRDRLIHPLGLPVCCPDDISKFFKRFNKYCFKHVTSHYENFRYFCAHEYGPTTFRCHAHMLVFFNDRLIANRFQEILSACWTYGDSRAESVFSRGGVNYVAQYVNMSSHLPAFLTHHRLIPRPQFSKSPCIGSLSILAQDLRDIYYRLPLYRTVWDASTSKYVDLPNPSSYNYRFFPKCPRYSELSDHDRIVLYGVTDWCDTEGTFEGFWKNVQILRHLRLRSLCNRFERVLTDYCDFVESFSDEKDTLYNSLKRLYGLSLRVCWFAHRLEVPIDWLVLRIIEYWKRVDYEHLCDMYRYQEGYASKFPLSDLVYMYPCFVDDAKNVKTDIISDFFKYAFDSFGITSISDVTPFKDTIFYKTLKKNSESIYKDTHKRHEINSYLYSRKLQRLDPSLQKVLIKYHKSKSKSLTYET